MSASPESVALAHKLADERNITLPEGFESREQGAVSDAITAMLDRSVAQRDATTEEVDAVKALLDELGPRQNGEPWNIPNGAGDLAAFSARVEKWLAAKQYKERIASATAELESLGLSRNEVASTDEIPF